MSGVRSHNLLNKTSNKSSVEIIKNAVDLAESLCIVYTVYCIVYTITNKEDVQSRKSLGGLEVNFHIFFLQCSII